MSKQTDYNYNGNYTEAALHSTAQWDRGSGVDVKLKINAKYGKAQNK